MRVAFSNIAWDASEEAEVLPVLSSIGVAGVEIAPTKYWPGWDGATPDAVRQTVARLAATGFAVPSLQAILFGRPELKVFGSASDRAALLGHIEKVARIAEGLGAKTLVFGSPSNRDPGALAPAAAMTAAVEVMRAAGDVCAQRGVWLGIEANPEAYGCRFMTHWFEAAELVRRCDSPGIRLHLDAACTFLAGDDLADAVHRTRDILAHVHVSEPHLGPIHEPAVDHAKFAGALKSVGYTGWCSVEMRRTADPVADIRHGATLAMAIYG